MEENKLSFITQVELTEKISKLENEEELIVYGVEKDEGNPPLAMGIKKTQVFDGISVFLCNVIGSLVDFQCIEEEEGYENDAYKDVTAYCQITAITLCGSNFSHLAIEL